MILSVSRRTDIPAYFSQWFINRLKEGYVYTRNPMNHRQVSKINLSKEVVDLIIFWTKNPRPMMAYLEDIQEYPFYFQVTITPYGSEIEENLPKKELIIESFIELFKRIGKERIVWRYDPILISDTYSVEDHLRDFANYASILAPYASKCVISFYDYYPKSEKIIKRLGIRSPQGQEIEVLLSKISDVSKALSLKVETCSEELDFSKYGIEEGACIDLNMIENILSETIEIPKDRGQRPTCKCVKSVDVGMYNTCLNGCAYCYANYSKASIVNRLKDHTPNGPFLIGSLEEEDQVIERSLQSYKTGQIKLL